MDEINNILENITIKMNETDEKINTYEQKLLEVDHKMGMVTKQLNDLEAERGDILACIDEEKDDWRYYEKKKFELNKIVNDFGG